MGKIALVHDFLFTYGGAERVLQEMHRIFPDAPIYTLLAEPEVIARHFPNATVHTSSLQHSPLRKWPRLLIAAMPRATEEFVLSEYDTVISSSGAFSHGVITGPDTRHICYCHSPMRYAWDWHANYLAEHGLGTPGKRLLAQLVMGPIRSWDFVASSRPDVWLANSHTVQRRISTFYRQESKVVFPPVDTGFFDPAKAKRPSTAGSKPYAISASRLSAYKRVDIMIEACARQGLALYVIGAGEDESRLRAIATQQGTDVTFLGRVSEEAKRDWISDASCYLFAANDDFGIAPVEALSLGIPVLAYGQGGATEYVQHGKNGFLFAEQTADSLSESIRHFLDNGISFSASEIRGSAMPFSTETFRSALAKEARNA